MTSPPYELPENLRAFWEETAQAAFTAPLDFHRSFRSDLAHPTHVVETTSFRDIGGETLHGWLAYPESARRLPAFLWVPPYGRESVLPNAYGTREGFVSASFNFHGESAFHQEKYVMTRGYFALGIDDPETWVFRRMLQNAILAARVLQSHVEVAEDQVAAMGMSQGAGISIWLGAWCPIIKAVCADMPFLGLVGSTLLNSVYRYPLKEIADHMQSIPLGEQRVLHTLSYFDTSFQARFCDKPTQVSLGLKDPACKPETVRAIYESLPGHKHLQVYDWGHDWHPDMVANNAAWLRKHLR